MYPKLVAAIVLVAAGLVILGWAPPHHENGATDSPSVDVAERGGPHADSAHRHSGTNLGQPHQSAGADASGGAHSHTQAHAAPDAGHPDAMASESDHNIEHAHDVEAIHDVLNRLIEIVHLHMQCGQSSAVVDYNHNFGPHNAVHATGGQDTAHNQHTDQAHAEGFGHEDRAEGHEGYDGLAHHNKPEGHHTQATTGEDHRGQHTHGNASSHGSAHQSHGDEDGLHNDLLDQLDHTYRELRHRLIAHELLMKAMSAKSDTDSTANQSLYHPGRSPEASGAGSEYKASRAGRP